MKSVQAKDIPDEAIECALITATLARDSYWASRWDIQELLPQYPAKVVNAKLNALDRRGILEGCTAHHNCRGDWEIA